MNIADVIAKLQETPPAGHRKQRNVILFYNGDFDIKESFKVMESRLLKVKAVLCVGEVDGGMLMYIRKEHQKTLPNPDLPTIDEVVVKPKFYRFKAATRKGGLRTPSSQSTPP